MLRNLVLVLCLGVSAAFQAPGRMGAVARPTTVSRNFAPVMEEVEDKVKSIIAEQLGVEASAVVPDASFTEDLGADSLDAVELIMAIE